MRYVRKFNVRTGADMKRNNHPMGVFTFAVTALLLAACAAGPVNDPAAERARAALTRLQSEPELASRATFAIGEAEKAVLAAEVAEDAKSASQLGYIAEKKVEIARALADRRLAEDQRKMSSVERERIRLEARTREAEAAQADAALSKAQARIANQQAGIARQQANAANLSAEQSRQETEEMKRQMLDLNAKMTDRGMVLTLGDVLFASGQSDLMPGASSKLNEVCIFLKKYEDRTVTIEGHTDNVGSASFNRALSQTRAEAVRVYLASQGISAARIVANGMGESLPVASNDNASGRQQNRRVEIIIGKPNFIGNKN